MQGAVSGQGQCLMLGALTRAASPDENNLLEKLRASFSGRSQEDETSADNSEVLASAGLPRFVTAFARGSQQDARSLPPERARDAER